MREGLLHRTNEKEIYEKTRNMAQSDNEGKMLYNGNSAHEDENRRREHCPMSVRIYSMSMVMRTFRYSMRPQQIDRQTEKAREQ
jgi:hypothetical protein